MFTLVVLCRNLSVVIYPLPALHADFRGYVHTVDDANPAIGVIVLYTTQWPFPEIDYAFLFPPELSAYSENLTPLISSQRHLISLYVRRRVNCLYHMHFRTRKMCTDCPPRLLPFHVKPRPRLVCTNVSALPGNAPNGEVWNQELCPEWCLATTPVSQTQTESGPVDVRSCPVNVPQP